MLNSFDKNWTSNNNGCELGGQEVERLISVRPSAAQFRLARKPFYCFVHFGMNTCTGREWGAGVETPKDFNIQKIKVEQWVGAIKSAGATGLILTCKHHDGFCLWHTKYTDFSVENSPYKEDIVKKVAAECKKAGLDFGIYLSPWDMHEKSYGTPQYNNYFCDQLTELLIGYGEIFEVWFDGAKGAGAKDFTYDWQRYYKIVRALQPKANIAICGPDIRWVGNEGGITRKSEFSVVPKYLQSAESTAKDSQHSEAQAKKMQHFNSKTADLGSRKVLRQFDELCWYPAEVDVSTRNGWFWNSKTNGSVKSGKRLFDIYLNSVGNNCTLLLNVPPTNKGTVHRREVRALAALGKKINEMTAKPVIVQSLGELCEKDGYIDFEFSGEKRLKYIIIKEDIRFSQRVEKFDIYLKKANGKFKKAYGGTVIGAQKIIKLQNAKCCGARLIIRQSRSSPVISEIGFYE
ncbi:MAG: alpha-L-fucosidase [Clostridiales bacterium]|nr:alpha-L-fucosidase [Clostridiales bacterium]